MENKFERNQVRNQNQFQFQSEKYQQLRDLSQKMTSLKFKSNQFKQVYDIKEGNKNMLLYFTHKKQDLNQKINSKSIFNIIQRIQRKEMRLFFQCLKNVKLSMITNKVNQSSFKVKLKTQIFRNIIQVVLQPKYFREINYGLNKIKEFTKNYNTNLPIQLHQEKQENKTKDQRAQLLKQIHQVSEQIIKTKKSMEDDKNKYHLSKEQNHIKITNLIQQMKFNSISEDHGASFDASNQSLNTLYCELLGKGKKDKMVNEQRLMMDCYLNKSIVLQEKVDDIRQICEKARNNISQQISQVEKELVHEALKVLELKPLGFEI